MSYLSRLEEARRQLVSGDFLAAERHYWAAREEWEKSRLRAPLIEKGVEPLLRMGGRLFGRDPKKPVLATFPELESRMLSDLADVAALLRRQAVEKAQLPGEQLSAEDVEILARTLALVRESRVYRLEADELRAATYNYLEGSRRHGRALDVSLLPDRLSLDDDDCRWLVEWARGRRRRRGDDARALSAWLVRMLHERARPGGALADDADALALLCESKLDDPAGAAQALDYGRRALAQPRPAADAVRLLRVVTGLATNEDRLAIGVIDHGILHELGETAARLGVSWPPPEIAELLERRHARVASRQIAVAWHEGERRVLVLRMAEQEPVDVLLLQIDDGAGGLPFACGMREARQAIERSVAERASVLTASEAPDWVRGLLGERRCLVLDRLEEALGPAPAGQAPAAPRSVHPVFDGEDPLAAAWQSLLQDARWLLPRLLAHARRDCFAQRWGLENLEALGAAGVGVAELLARAMRAAGSAVTEFSVELQRVPGPLQLRWPWLWERSRERGDDASFDQVERGVDLLLLHRPQDSELAAYAVAHAPSTVFVDGDERAEAVAGSASAALDPTRVTVVPRGEICPENAVRLLELWAEESLARPERGFDVLWLYAALASVPEGGLHGVFHGHEGARTQLTEALAAAPAPCRFEIDASCFRHQLEERRRRSLVCVDQIDALGADDESIENLLVDDLLACSARLGDFELCALLDRVAIAWQRSSRAALWISAPRFGEAMLRSLDALFGERTPQLRTPKEAGVPLGFHCVPDGYRLGAAMLGREADALLRGRLRRWADRRGSKVLWRLPGDGASEGSDQGIDVVRGATTQPTATTVVLPRLFDGPSRNDLAMLRLAAAASWAKAELVVLDPCINDHVTLCDRAPGLRDWSPERSLMADGRLVLGELPAREIPHWKRPLHAERLRSLASVLQRDLSGERAAELAQLLEPIAEHGRWVLGAVRDDERSLIAGCIARLARESMDGGPLGVRTVIWTSELDTEARGMAVRLGLRHAALGESDAQAVEEVLLELEAGRIQWLQLHPRALANDDIRRFARRARSALWVVPRAERWLDGHPGAREEFVAALSSLGELLASADARCIAFVDEPDPSEASAQLVDQLGLRARSLVTPPLETVWTLRRRRLPDPIVACPGCGEAGALAHARQPCPYCAVARLDRPEPRVVAHVALLGALRSTLQQAGPQSELLLVAADAHAAAELRQLLGIETRTGDELFVARGSSDGYAQRVRTLADLYDAAPGPMRLVLPELPRRARELRALLWRLSAASWPGGELEIFDHPVAWDLGRTDDPEWGLWGPGATLHELRWRAGRSEIEFRVRQAERAPSTASREKVFERRGLGPNSLNEFPANVVLAPLLDRLESLGLGFEEEASALPVLRLDAFESADRECLRWLVQEALLDAQPRGVSDHQGEAHDREFEEAMLSLPFENAAELPPLPASHARPRAEEIDSEAAELGSWNLGVAASGRTERLLRCATLLPNRRRRLLLLPGAAGLLAVTERCGALRPRVEVATISELELAFLRHHHQADGYGRPPRLLPAAISEEGRRLRAELLRDLSRRYAAVAGSVPAVDIEDLQLLIEGRAPRIAAAMEQGSSSSTLDLGLLEQCAIEARREAGWITATELRRWSRESLEEHPYIAEAWRHRYAAILVDDAHALAADELAFVERLFPAAARVFAADPNLLEARPGIPVGGGKAESYRLPRELARAASSMLAREPGRSVAPRSRRRGKGTLESQQVLNLGAVALRIEEDARAGLHVDRRNAIFVSHRGDLDPLAARLRESGLEVWPVDEIARTCVEGPRQLLAALQLIHGLGAEMPAEEMAELAVVLLRSEGLWSPALDRHALARRLVSWRHGVGTEATRPGESLLLVLLDLQRQLASVWSLAEAAQKLADCGLLARILRSDAVVERLRRFLEHEGERPWRVLPGQIPVRALADPLQPGAHLWILRPEDATGLEFDRVYSICSGLEPHEHHYRALSRVREHLVVLHAERDPFGDRP